MKKLISLVLAIMMVAVVGLAFADDPAPAAQSPTGSRTLDSAISVSGLESGDKVDFYKVLAWQDSVGWVAAGVFGGEGGLTATEVTTIAGKNAEGGGGYPVHIPPDHDLRRGGRGHGQSPGPGGRVGGRPGSGAGRDAGGAADPVRGSCLCGSQSQEQFLHERDL